LDDRGHVAAAGVAPAPRAHGARMLRLHHAAMERQGQTAEAAGRIRTVKDPFTGRGPDPYWRRRRPRDERIRGEPRLP